MQYTIFKKHCDYFKDLPAPNPSPIFPFPLQDTILKKHCDYVEDLSSSYSSSNGKRIKGELTGVGNLFLTPVLNFEGERLQARTGPSLQLLLKNPQVFAVITNRRFCAFYHMLFFNIVSMKTGTGACW